MDELRLDPVLSGPTADRDVHFRHRDAAHTQSVLPLDWHIRALYDAGHAEAGLVWRGLRDAAVLDRVA